MTELRCTFGGQSIVPDVCFFAEDRILRDPKGRLVDDVFLPPDLAIEVLSPGQTVKNLTLRMERAVRDGVRLGWLIQPAKDCVYVFRPGLPPTLVDGGAVLSGDDVLPGFPPAAPGTLRMAQLSLPSRRAKTIQPPALTFGKSQG